MKDQDQPLEVSIVIPVFDEAENIGPLHTAICAAMVATPFEVNETLQSLLLSRRGKVEIPLGGQYTCTILCMVHL